MTTMRTVPKMAGKIPPSVFDSRGSSETNSQILRGVDRGLAGPREIVRPDDSDDVADEDGLLPPVGVGKDGRRPGNLAAGGLQALTLRLVPLLELGDPSPPWRRGRRGGRAPCASSAFAEAKALLLEQGVDGADVLPLPLVQLGEAGMELLLEGRKRREALLVPARDDLVAFPDLLQEAVEVPVLLPLEKQGVLRRVALRDLSEGDPPEVEAVQVPVRRS